MDYPLLSGVKIQAFCSISNKLVNACVWLSWNPTCVGLPEMVLYIGLAFAFCEASLEQSQCVWKHGFEVSSQ